MLFPTHIDIEPFGEALIETRDLDPVYCAIHGARLPKPQLARLLLSYSLFYHLGAAAWLSEQDDFWGACREAARNETLAPMGERWPRGAERRHFRGPKCVEAVKWFSKQKPEYYLSVLQRSETVEDVLRETGRWPQFGPWVGFKIADLLERCAGVNIRFFADVCLLYEGPRSALLARAPKEPERELNRLIDYFGEFEAPPANDRKCGYQEIETVLCKHAGYVRGTYRIGKDIREVRHALEGWGKTADLLRANAPK